MAAARAQMRALFSRLGFIGQGPVMLTVDQGIADINELSALDDEEIETLLKLLRRPGGTVANPNAADPGQPAFIQAPGISVSMRAATNLKLAVYFLRHKLRTSRTITAPSHRCRHQTTQGAQRGRASPHTSHRQAHHQSQELAKDNRGHLQIHLPPPWNQENTSRLRHPRSH